MKGSVKAGKFCVYLFAVVVCFS